MWANHSCSFRPVFLWAHAGPGPGPGCPEITLEHSWLARGSSGPQTKPEPGTREWTRPVLVGDGSYFQRELLRGINRISIHYQ